MDFNQKVIFLWQVHRACFVRSDCQQTALFPDPFLSVNSTHLFAWKIDEGLYSFYVQLTISEDRGSDCEILSAAVIDFTIGS